MKFGKRILLLAACAALLLISWFIAVTADSDKDKQESLIAQAEELIADEIYVRAVPLLEEAAGYDAEYQSAAEELLKGCYVELFETSGYARKYTNLLDTQMARESAAPDVFMEAAKYYLGKGKISDALKILVNGIEKTGDESLKAFYEANRYEYTINRSVYEYASEIYGGAVQVMREGKWGLASAEGDLIIPCMYDKISTWSGGQAVVMLDGVISAVDEDNNRVARLHGEATDFGNLASERIGLKMSDGWHIASNALAFGTVAFEELGTVSDGAMPAKKDGKWGLANRGGSEWVVPNEYDGIISDSLGRAYSGNAVFVLSGGNVKLLADGAFVGESYEDARPFIDGLAAVKKNGKWGFIDTAGTLQIDYRFDDALSFSGHLAAVKQDENWGYISLAGDIVIEPVFIEAKSFFEGNAPVRTEDGWQFITLLEYM